MHSDFQRMFAVFGVFAVLLVLVAAVTKINLKDQATPPGSNGQLLFNNNGVVDAEDPVVSQSNAALLNATVVGTGTFAVQAAQSGSWTVTANAGTGTFATSSSQLPAALDGSGFLKVHEQGTAAVSGTVTANQGGTWTVQPGNTANTTAWKVDGSAVTQPVSGTVTANAGSGIFNIQSNASVNLAQFNGSAVGSTNPQFMRECDGTNCVTIDPCRINANSFAKISQTTSAQVITGTSAKKTYICSINLVTAGANNVAVVEGTGTVCATGIAGVSTGGTTAATGWNFAANGGLTEGSGLGSVMAASNANADNVCILQSAAVQLSGVIGYVQQ